MGVTYPFHSPLCSVWSCLPWPSSMSGHICHGVHYLPASIGIDVVPSALCMYSFQGLQPHRIIWSLHLSSVDALVDIHSRSHNFPFFHTREALLVGHWVTALPLFSCSIHFVSPLTEVVLHGVGLVHLSHVWWLPIHKGMPTSDALRSQFWWEDSWPSMLVHHFIRGDVGHDQIHHLLSLLFPPILAFHLSLKSTHLH